MKKKIISLLLAGIITALAGCGNTGNGVSEDSTEAPGRETEQEDDAQTGQAESGDAPAQASSASVTEGTEEYRGFTLDNVLHSENNGDVHFNLYVPDSYDGSEPCAVFFTLPGYEGLYFQGAGENLYSENFGFEAQQYDPDMIIVAPQLSDWGDTSAEQTIELAEYFLANYNIDPDRVYGEGYSGGGYCTRTGKCRYDDRVNDFLETAKEYDGFIFGAPVHFASAAASMSAFMDRSFFVDHCADLKLFELKPGAVVVSARRAGTTAALDQMNKYLLYAQMPVVSSRYWNMVHGQMPEQVPEDKEGVQIMRVLGKNMAWLLKSIEAGRNAGIVQPEKEARVSTNYIR